MRVQEEKEKITCALTASNQSRMQQGQLLAKELEKVQILFSEKHAMLEHVLHTRSWKITAPLRQLEKLIRYRCVYALFGSLKDVWEDFGKPFPKLTHTVRHRIFGKFPPKEH